MAPFFGEPVDEIPERAGGCISELSGRRDRPMERSHLIHGSSDECNQACNGLYVTDYEHLAFHELHVRSPKKIGLSDHWNHEAARKIHDRIVAYNLKHNCQLEYDSEMSAARNAWRAYFLTHELPTKQGLSSALLNKRKRQVRFAGGFFSRR